MDPLLKRAFVVETGQQVRQAMLAVEIVNDGAEGDSDRVWLGISALLGAAANISKILWPSSNAEPRTALLEHLGVSEDSPLASRTLRNHFEHMDERIDRWWRQSPSHNIVDTYVGSRSAITVGPHYAGDWFRTFDPETSVVTFHEDRFDLQSLVDELVRISPRCSPPWFGEEPGLGRG